MPTYHVTAEHTQGKSISHPCTQGVWSDPTETLDLIIHAPDESTAEKIARDELSTAVSKAEPCNCKRRMIPGSPAWWESVAIAISNTPPQNDLAAEGTLDRQITPYTTDDHMRNLLRTSGYNRLWTIRENATNAPGTLECWSGPRGNLIVQIFHQPEPRYHQSWLTSASIYHENDIPQAWSSLETWLLRSPGRPTDATDNLAAMHEDARYEDEGEAAYGREE